MPYPLSFATTIFLLLSEAKLPSLSHHKGLPSLDYGYPKCADMPSLAAVYHDAIIRGRAAIIQ
jgi:hypothetical protein